MRKSYMRRYIVFRVKAMEFLDLLVLLNSLHGMGNNATVPIPSFPQFRPARFVADSIRTVVLSWFCVFIDKSKDGMDVIALWSEVFPKHKSRIQTAWKGMEPAWEVLRTFRDSAGFHADKPMKFFAARLEVRTKFDSQINAALREFETLFKFLLKAEESELKDELEPALDSLLGDLEKKHKGLNYQREQFKSYLMIVEVNQKGDKK